MTAIKMYFFESVNLLQISDYLNKMKYGIADDIWYLIDEIKHNLRVSRIFSWINIYHIVTYFKK